MYSGSRIALRLKRQQCFGPSEILLEHRKKRTRRRINMEFGALSIAINEMRRRDVSELQFSRRSAGILFYFRFYFNIETLERFESDQTRKRCGKILKEEKVYQDLLETRVRLKCVYAVRVLIYLWLCRRVYSAE